MKFLFLCDQRAQKSMLALLAASDLTGIEIVPVTGNEFAKAKGILDGINGLLVERSTWQRNFALFRYLELLPEIEKVNFAVLSPGSRREDFVPLKGRSAMRTKETQIAVNGKAEEVDEQLRQFVSIPTPSYQHRVPLGQFA
jgi:hypothetical protein